MDVLTRYSRLLALLAVLLATPVYAQDLPAFDIDAVSVRGSEAGLSRLDVYTKVSHALLNFTNVQSGYQAKYQVSLDVYRVDDRGRQQSFVANRVWDRTLAVREYAATLSDKIVDRTTQSVDLPAGRYLLQFRLEDGTTRRSYTHEVTTLVRDLNGRVALSDLILIDGFDSASNTISPTVANRVSTDDKGLQLFYEIYASGKQDVRVTREVVRERSRSAVRTALGLRDDPSGDVAYANVTPTSLRVGRNPFVVMVPLSDLRTGNYVVRVKLEQADGTVIAQAEKKIEAVWQGLTQHIANLDEAIAQMGHVAKDRDLKYIREGATEQERLARFRSYWKRLDPTPGTDRNERMEEYYYRVAYANDTYSRSIVPGWQTDRGLVMVRFGEPDHVKRHPFNFDTKPYEEWIYTRLGRRFIFVDKSGLGDHELLVPIWDDRTRLR